ncbi:uncharacterized protein RJT20DRAFT_136277 [Scheffersomyces xylosifermentans]|uniref:uncharacterized protein n=1 Tax=Scheffersomyces xylosifermentans TaxID=1304137 RepID=UPI00315C5514
MYRQPSQTYGSTDSLRRLSSNNPFRQHVEQPIGSSQIEHPTRTSLTLGSDRVPTPPTNFEDWIEKNKQLIDGSDEDDVYEEPSRHHSTGHTSNSSSGDFAKPVFPPRPVRADSDSSVNYSSKYV